MELATNLILKALYLLGEGCEFELFYNIFT